MKKNYRSDFTLIELLIVIAIIAILAAMFLPALEKSRGMAQKSICVSQEKQVGIAIIGYINDFNDYLPYLMRRAAGDNSDRGRDFASIAKPREWPNLSDWLCYIQNPKVFDCPGDTTRAVFYDFQRGVFDSNEKGAYYLLNLSYFFNFKLHEKNPVNGKPGFGRKMGYYKKTSMNIMYYEEDRKLDKANDLPDKSSANYYISSWISTCGINPAHFFMPHHLTGNNFLLMDGHVEFHTYKSYVSNLKNKGEASVND